MKRKIFSPLALLTVLVVSMFGLTSCDNDEPYSTVDFLTYYNWELVAVNDRPIGELDVCEFQFYNFGNGIYGSYNMYGSWNEISIRWDVDYAPGGAQYLYVDPLDGSMPWEYIMRCYDGYPAQLVLTDLFTGDVLTFQSY